MPKLDRRDFLAGAAGMGVAAGIENKLNSENTGPETSGITKFRKNELQSWEKDLQSYQKEAEDLLNYARECNQELGKIKISPESLKRMHQINKVSEKIWVELDTARIKIEAFKTNVTLKLKNIYPSLSKKEQEKSSFLTMNLFFEAESLLDNINLGRQLASGVREYTSQHLQNNDGKPLAPKKANQA